MNNQKEFILQKIEEKNTAIFFINIGYYLSGFIGLLSFFINIEFIFLGINCVICTLLFIYKRLCENQLDILVIKFLGIFPEENLEEILKERKELNKVADSV